MKKVSEAVRRNRALKAANLNKEQASYAKVLMRMGYSLERAIIIAYMETPEFKLTEGK
jgi:hypothetical protein